MGSDGFGWNRASCWDFSKFLFKIIVCVEINYCSFVESTFSPFLLVWNTLSEFRETLCTITFPINSSQFATQVILLEIHVSGFLTSFSLLNPLISSIHSSFWSYHVLNTVHSNSSMNAKQFISLNRKIVKIPNTTHPTQRHTHIHIICLQPQ